MKNLKKFETFTNPKDEPGEIIYYKIHVKKSLDRFEVALDKLGIKKNVFW
jgi:hypothetical protein